MGKRFEGEEPTFLDLVAAFQALGLADSLGAPGEATAYATRLQAGDCIEFGVIPGNFSAREIADLTRWAA